MSSYALARCELYTKIRHGFMNNELDNCIICMETIYPDEMLEFIRQYLWKDTVCYILSNISYTKLMDIRKSLGTLQVTRENWKRFYDMSYKYIEDPYFDKLHIVKKMTYTDSIGDIWTCCVLKTFWIKLIQRRWKNIYKKRMHVIRNRMIPKNILRRERNGKWPTGLNHLYDIFDMQIS